MESCENHESIVKKYPQAHQVQEFFKRCCFEPVVGESEGTSWMELYTLYRMCGGKEASQNKKGLRCKSRQ